MKNITKLIEYLKNTLHIDVSIRNKKLNYTKSIPLIIKINYDIFNLRIDNKNIVLLSTKEDDILSIKKNLKLFRESLSIPIIMHIENISDSTKKYLIENNIPFVSEKVIYLPQLLIYFNDFKRKYEKIKDKKLSKLAQIILISFIVNKQDEVNIADSANVFNVTKMSIGRALMELENFGYLKVKKIGRLKKYFKQPINIEKMFRELKNPVTTTLYIKREDLNIFDKKVEASFSALTRYANITNSQPIYAIEKSYFKQVTNKNDKFIIYDKKYDDNLIQIELWRYNPSITNENIVDPISLYLSLEDKIDVDDSRANDAIIEVYNKIKGMLN